MKILPRSLPLPKSNWPGLSAHNKLLLLHPNMNPKLNEKPGTEEPRGVTPPDFVKPCPQEIAGRAYFMYVNEGFPQGHDVQHWLEAERQFGGRRPPLQKTARSEIIALPEWRLCRNFSLFLAAVRGLTRPTLPKNQIHPTGERGFGWTGWRDQLRPGPCQRPAVRHGHRHPGPFEHRNVIFPVAGKQENQ